MSSSFRGWLIVQQQRSDRVGKFAREMTDDPNAPNTTDLSELHEYLQEHGWPKESHDALQEAYQEWWDSTFSPTGHM